MHSAYAFSMLPSSSRCYLFLYFFLVVPLALTMQVNKSLFPATYDHFVELLSTCDFYAFDEEMTGINTPEIVESVTFTPEDCYRAKSFAATRYNMIQVGICLFHRDASGGRDGLAKYIARPFNFLLFPGTTEGLGNLSSPAGTPAGRATDVVVSPSALAFLRRHNMDFQAWVYEGMSFCNSQTETLIRRLLEEKYADSAAHSLETSSRLFTDDEKRWVEDAVKASEVLLCRADSAAKATEGMGSLAAESPLVAGGKETLLSPQQSRNAREYLTAYLKQTLPRVSVHYCRQGLTYSATLSVLTEGEARLKREQAVMLREREVRDAVGFRLIFRALVDSRKPCVGHNCFADILFLMAALDEPLPVSLSQWKTRVSSLFPTIFDTKYLSSRRDLFPRGRFTASHLGGLFDAYGLKSSQVEVSLPLGFQSYDPQTLLRGCSGGRSSPAHEAGYDALMTGTLLLNLLAELGTTVATAPADLSSKVALFRSLYAVNTRDGSEDEYTPRDQCVLDLRHEPSVRLHHLEACFCSSGLPDTTLHSVDESRTLAIVSAVREDAATLASMMSSRYPKFFDATAYQPPHILTARLGSMLRNTGTQLMRSLV